MRRPALAITAAALVLACGGDPRSRVIGKWEDESAPEVIMEFFKGGTVAADLGTEVVNGTWSLAGDRILIDIERAGARASVVGELEGKKLRLTFGDQSGIFRRKR